MSLADSEVLVELRKRAQKAAERSKKLAEQSCYAKYIHRKIRRNLFKERDFDRLPTTVKSKYYGLKTAIEQESGTALSSLERLKEALFIEHSVAPKMDLQELSKLQIQDS